MNRFFLAKKLVSLASSLVEDLPRHPRSIKTAFASYPTLLVECVVLSDLENVFVSYSKDTQKVLAAQESKSLTKRQRSAEKRKQTIKKAQKLRFYDAELTPRGGISNLLKLYSMTTPEERDYWGDFYINGWHQIQDIAEDYNERYKKVYGMELTPITVAGVVAILSGNLSWERNLKDAISILVGQPKGNAWGPNKAAAERFARNPDPALIGGEKIGPFFDSFVDSYGQEDTVVVDGHMFNIWKGKIQPLKGLKVGSLLKTQIQKDVREAASIVGITPQQMQAITWFAWRSKILNDPLKQPGEDHPPPPAAYL